MPRSTAQRPKKRPWLRVALVVLYVCIGVLGKTYEANARQVLRKGMSAENLQRYETAGLAYMLVVERFPLSSSVVGARLGLERVDPALSSGALPARLRETEFERLLGAEFNPYSMDWVPFLAPFVCGVVLVVVLVTRFRRGGVVMLSFFLIAGCSYLAVGQLDRHGFVDQPDFGQQVSRLFEQPHLPYLGSYVLLALTGFMTLLGTGTPDVVVSPLTTQRELAPTPRKSADEVRALAGARGSAVVPGSLEGRLRMLDELHRKGLISDSETKVRRQELLAEV